MQVEIANVSNHPLQYDSNQTKFFVIITTTTPPAERWSNTDCSDVGKGVPPVTVGPLTLQPADHVVLDQATYPGAESCRTLNGTYDVEGLGGWCPPGSTAKGFWDTSKTRDLPSAPVRI